MPEFGKAATDVCVTCDQQTTFCCSFLVYTFTAHAALCDLKSPNPLTFSFPSFFVYCFLSLPDFTDYSRSSPLWGQPRQHHLRHSISRWIPAATMLRPDTAQASFRYQSFPFHAQYSIEDDFISKPTIPKTHMPHSALVKQVQRGWGGAHYVREMSVATGRDTMKMRQWNDISA